MIISGGSCRASLRMAVISPALCAARGSPPSTVSPLAQSLCAAALRAWVVWVYRRRDPVDAHSLARMLYKLYICDTNSYQPTVNTYIHSTLTRRPAAGCGIIIHFPDSY